jgi:hypothetical protein
VVISVTEAEACIPIVEDRFWRRALKLWTDIYTLPKTNPLRRNIVRMRKFRKCHCSPLYQMAEIFKDITMEDIEMINSFTLVPWENRLQINTDKVTMPLESNWSVYIAVSSSMRNDRVGISRAIQIGKYIGDTSTIDIFFIILGPRTE